ncbi:MAG: SDR family NAD(P)-dependent oxidoreductase [Kiritimatiellia bacterium]
MIQSPSVLITGTSSGIGRAAAVHMKNLGWRVFACARKAEDLDELSAAGFEAVEMDMSLSASIESAAEKVLRLCDQQLDGLVNNAGYGQPGALEDLSPEAMRRQFEVNVVGLQHLTNCVLPCMIQRGSGRIVHVSSVVGRIALPFMGIYSASKFAVEAMADAQRVELRGTGVKLSLIEPGPIETRFSKNALTHTGHDFSDRDSRFSALYARELNRRAQRSEPKPFSLPPEAVARKIAHALTSRHPRRRYPVTLPAHLGAWMRRLSPDALLEWILSAELKKRSPGEESSSP